MRIASISTLSSGGATIAGFRIGEAMQRLGHECQFYTLDTAKGYFDCHSFGCGVPERDMDTLSRLYVHWEEISDDKTFIDGTELFSSPVSALFPLQPFPSFFLNADVVHLHWVAGMFFSPSLLRMLEGKKVIFTLHDMNIFTGGCHYHANCRKFETHCQNCPMLKFPGSEDISFKSYELKKKIYSILRPTVVAPSRWMLAEAQKSSLLDGCNCVRIPYTLDLEVFKPCDRQCSRKNLGIADNTFALLIGADSLSNTRKNYKVFVEAMSIIAMSSPQISITVITYGNGDVSGLPFPVVQLGYVDAATTLVGTYNAADVYIHTALLDNLPNVLCEAQACGTPAIVFDRGGCSDTIIDKETGFVLSGVSAVDLASCICSAFENKHMMASMRTAARDFALKQFSQSCVVEQYEHVLGDAEIAGSICRDSDLWNVLMENSFTSLAVLHPLRHHDDYVHSENNLRKFFQAIKKNFLP